VESNHNHGLLSPSPLQPVVQFEIFTLFPDVFEPYLDSSILQRARQGGFMDVKCHNIRDWAPDRHHVTDDEPYGGGGGMVLKPEPVFAAVESIFGSSPNDPVILLTPQGRLFTQKVAEELMDRMLASPAGDQSGGSFNRVGFICGRYEGVDERIRSNLANDEISIGDYVLTGGELAAMVIIDALTRLIPGVLGDPGAAGDDSHAAGLLEYPHYTRPGVYRGWSVPEVLLSGDHARIEKWRREQALLRTRRRRPDLLEGANLSEEDIKFLSDLDANERS